ncbi:hypothetical protein Ocin01_07824 [Orchesella cincta]|uniref:Uncharacterized protein n=1 Tax=Orchesella cincta TaxID=48709 RepID=A0A1D2N0N7_ORCCI|nr:hypothetical protein Ocin01_07824 [Orchesella cincta]
MATSTPSRKRQLEHDDNFEEEAADTVDPESLPVSRGRKQARRVSGVFKDSIISMGAEKAEVMESVLNVLPSKDVMEIGAAGSLSYIIACRVLRKRYGKSTFIRYLHVNGNPRHLWINWELHFHDELLAGTEQDPYEPVVVKGKPKVPKPVIPTIRALLTIGNRAAFSQITDAEAKTPFREDFVYAICQSAYVSFPNDRVITTFYDKFGLGIAAQSLFIPRSPSFTLKAFGLDVLKEEWTENIIKGKLELHEADLESSDHKLTAVLLFKYMNNEFVQNFKENFSKSYKDVELLSGCAEEVGSNKTYFADVASGFSIYTGAGATVSIYGVDFSKESTNDILSKAKEQVESSTMGFCFLVSYDGRPSIKKEPTNGDDDGGWEEYDDPEPINKFLKTIRAFIPKIQVLGIQSAMPLDLINVKNSNVEPASALEFSCGLLVFTYS